VPTIVNALAEALTSGRALPAMNAPGFDAMVGMSKASHESGEPMVIQTSARIVERHGAKAVKAWFDAARTIAGGSCFLHLDHCSDDNTIAACIAAGWDMVMFDGSHLSIEENCARSTSLVNLAHAAGTAVEGEVGPVGGEEDGRSALAQVARLEDVELLATRSGIDCIAVGFGNVHGNYTTTANLRWDVYERAHAVAQLPLVLHGGSGLSAAEFHRAIGAGTAKINISTELKTAYTAVATDPVVIARMRRDPALIHDGLERAAYDLALRYISLFRSDRGGTSR